jgi:MFS family permease
VYILGALVFYIVAILADRTQRRAPFMIFCGLFTMAGYAVLLGSTTPGVLYFACFLVMGGAYVMPGLNITWLNANTTPHYKRATAVGLNQTIGNMGGIIAGQIYLARESPHYVTGQAVSLVGIGLSWCGTLVMWWILSRKNSEKERKLQAGVADTGRGDESLYFRYNL